MTLFKKNSRKRSENKKIAGAIIATGYTDIGQPDNQSYQPYEVFPSFFYLLDKTTLMEIIECSTHR